MECKEAQIISIGHIMGDLEFSFEQYQELEAHLASCQVCAEEYESSKWAIKYIEEHKAEFAEALRTPEEKKAAEQEEIERSWKRMEAELDKLEAQERKEKQAKIRRVFVRVSAVAACLVIGILTWITFSIHSTPKIAPKLTPQQITSAPKPSVRIELVSKNGNILVPANQQIVSADKLKTLLINGKHRMVLNSDTALSIDPLLNNERAGWMVKLTSGEIFAHVEHDGNPFVVSTAHGKAIITGTTFDVKVTDTITTLVVSEGTVQFEFEKSLVQVKTGQISKIVANSAPTKPISCNTAELTAWATGYEIKTALAKIKSFSEGYDLTDLWLGANSGPIDLEAIDYDDWVEEKRDWFEREFPWIFQLQDALKKERIEVDYPELLIHSGDVWQFVYPESTSMRIPALNLESLLKAASQYGFNEGWLLENTSATKFVIDNPVFAEGRFTGLKAFNKWVSCFEQARISSKELDSRMLLYSLHASVYLANTRTLAWLSMAKGKHVFKAEDETAILALLQNQVNTANNLTKETIKLFRTAQGQPCDKHWESLERLIENINEITGVEKRRITEYEVRQ